MARQKKIKTEKKDDDNVVMDVGSDQSNSDGSGHDMVVDEVPSGHAILQGGRSGAHNDGDEDEEDYVVREIPVFLSPELSDQIQLVQFPLQARKQLLPDAVRIKPKHCMMEMDIQTPPNIEFNGLYHMPNRTFMSQTIPVSTHMALGKMIEIDRDEDNDDIGEPKQMGLHLVPLSRMVQMRPSFSHIDEAFASSNATTEEELRKQEQTMNASAEAGRKSISFRKTESERQELARKSSYAFKKVSEASEGWHHLEVYDEASLQSTLVMDKVACPVEHRATNLLDVKAMEKEYHTSTNKKIQGTSLNATYLNTLNYLPPRDDFGIKSISSLGKTDGGMELGDNNNDSDRQVHLASIVTKLVQLMRQGRPIPFSLLRAEFPKPSSKGGGISDTTLGVALGSCAVLVRGNWCLNSKLLSYPPAMTQCRTFMMCLFQSMRIVHRERLMRVFADSDGNATHEKRSSDDDVDDGEDKVTPEVIEMLLEQLGEKTREGWVMKVSDDVMFAQRHPQITLVHLQYWENQFNLFAPKIQKYRANV